MKNQIFDFNSIATGKPVKAIQQAFARAGVPVISIDADGKAKRTAGVSYKTMTLAFADSQTVELSIKQSGDVYRVSLNGSVVPLKSPDDHAKAVGEIAKMLDAGRAKFQAKMARTKVDVPKGIKTAAPKMEQQLAAQIQELDTKIAERRSTLEDLKAGQPVMDAAFKGSPLEIVVRHNGERIGSMTWEQFRRELRIPSGMSMEDAVKRENERRKADGDGTVFTVEFTSAAKKHGSSKKAAVMDAARKMNQRGYEFYVVAKGKIESGWEYQDDAKEHKAENMDSRLKAEAKIVKKSGLKALDLNPDDNSHWLTTAHLDSAQQEGDGEIDEPEQDDGKQGKLFGKKEGDDDETDQAMDAVGGYKISHQTFSAACAEAIRVAEGRGFTVDDDDWFSKVSSGPRKPQPGATNKYLIALLKDGKETKKALAFQVYGKENGDYELNCYIG